MKILGVITTACALTAGPGSALGAKDAIDARDAMAIMASVTVCNTTISEEEKRVLYNAILEYSHTVAAVSRMIGYEIDALNKLSPSDRAAMCSVLGERVKTLPGGG